MLATALALGCQSGLKTPASSPLPLLRLLPGGANQFPGGTCTRCRPSPFHGAGGPGEVHRGANTTSLAPAAQREAQRRKARPASVRGLSEAFQR